MDLIIVESPTKAKTISKFVGKGFAVESSYGHIRDLPKSKIGIDVAHDFTPSYMIPKKAELVVANLKALAKKADKVVLATDEDREGEAIAWHLVNALELDGAKPAKKGAAAAPAKPYERIAFHEITKSAIMEALDHPRALDVNLVDAQQARRVLDRLVGYELSPFLWRKIRYGLSAGRVQSVAVRLVVERERLIQAFNKEEYWTIEAMFLPPKGKISFPAVLNSINGKAVGKMGIKNESGAKDIIEGLKDANYRIADITVKKVHRNPAAPFTTSTLQQEAARKLGFSAKQTMIIAQHLYENGHITYMRTDSVNLAASALAQAQRVIGKEFGKEYQLPSPRYYSNKSKGAQEAHEAIRPSNLEAVSGGDVGLKDRGESRLYDLIWKRTIASQMKEATLEQTAVDIEANTPRHEIFRANGQTVVFDGFIRVYTEGKDDDVSDEIEGGLPKLEKEMMLALAKDNGKANPEPLQHFTEPAARYTDATLIKALEAEGVGRPSTYAPTLSTIQERGYVEKVDKKYAPTEIGILVNDLLVENFPEVVDIKFTSHIEEELDDIADGKLKWTEVCREFYGPFKKNLTEKEATVEKQVEISTTPCPHCGQPMLIKFGRMGKFLACPEPGVKVTLPMPEEAAQIKALEEKTKDERCPICGKPMKVTRGRFGFFLGCTDYPKCKGIMKIWNKTGFKCPNCLLAPVRREKPGDIVEKKSRGRGKPFYACTRYPDCTFVMNKRPESEEELQAALKHWIENPPKPKKDRPNKKGFSLVELLTTMALIAVLATVVILAINPIELFRQGRDATRISDMNTLNKAISLYYSDAMNDPSTLFMGTSSVIYVSVPDPTATSTAGDQCQGLGLPSLPTGFTYQCAASSSYMNISGTGWIPINFNSYSAGSVISKLPVDPVNTTSTNLYYTYETDGIGGFKVAAFFESQKDAPLMASDGGNDPTLYEKGTNLALASARGLVGYWPFKEGSGSTTYDQSGNGSNGVFVGNPIWTTGTTNLPSAIEIPSTGNNISFQTPSVVLPTTTITVALWENTASPLQNYPNYLDNNWITTGGTTSTPGAWDMFSTASGTFAWAILGPGQSTQNKARCFNAIVPNTWQYLVGTYDGTTMKAYVDGSLCGTLSLSGQSLWTGSYLTNADPYPYSETDLRIYNRAISAVEIQEMYNAEK